MARKRRDDTGGEETPSRRPPGRSWSTRIAWLVLVGGIVLVATRVSIATVVQVHGDGMAPTILDGDHVLFVRGSWGLVPGDIVIYDPTPSATSQSTVPGAPDELPQGHGDLHQHPDPSRDPGAPLRNTAVVDPEELERNWQRTQHKSGVARGSPRSGYRVGRILAVPGDAVTFNLADAALGLSVNGQPLSHKAGDPMRILLSGQHLAHSNPAAQLSRRATAFESVGDRRYTILRSATTTDVRWPALQIPAAAEGPVQVRAEGYLVLADNRDEGACCDSRAVGWVAADRVRGEILLRLPGDPALTPDLDPAARGSRWLP
jgi:signal peptidase I